MDEYVSNASEKQNKTKNMIAQSKTTNAGTKHIRGQTNKEK